jgi:D-arabinose 1-dehydrogenase-like Zn-dependent alcohol dehydrogenase
MPPTARIQGSHQPPSSGALRGLRTFNEAYERLLKSDVKYRFVIDGASLK